MIPVGSHGLDCISADDYGAIALYLQDQALTIDSTLQTISTNLSSFYLRPGFIGNLTVSPGPTSSGAEQLWFINGTWVVQYSNFTPAPTVGITGGVEMVVPKTGWYTFGIYANIAATGAVTALSRRTLYARAILRSTVSTTLAEVSWRTIDTNTGGEFLVASNGAFYATKGQIIDIVGLWSHTNAASTVQVNAGARIWCHWLGSGVQVSS